MIFVLHRYIFRELLKVFVLAVVALTLIMSLGIILRPIQEYGIGPRQVIHYMGYFLPITLTFVLPVAALFAAALVYGRFASDNELDACKASGISLATLVYPGLALAIIVAIATLLLSFHVVPDFFHRAEAALKADAEQILFRNIQQRGFYQIPGRDGYRIYADEANIKSNMLWGAVVNRIDQGRIRRIITTESAKISFSPHGTSNEVHIDARQVYQVDDEAQTWLHFERLPVQTRFPSLLGDDIKFKKVSELKRIRANPLEFSRVQEHARAAYAQLTAELLAQDIQENLSRSKNGFYQLTGVPATVKFSATNVAAIVDRKKDEQGVELSADVNALEYDSETKQLLRKLTCEEAVLKIEGDEFYPTLRMELVSPTWHRADGAEGIAAGREVIKGLVLPPKVDNKLNPQNILQTLGAGSLASMLRDGPSDKLRQLCQKLDNSINRTLANIKAETHTRLVFGVSCISLILIGIGLGIIFKGGHLLTAFGVSSVPAGLLIVCIMMGKNVAKHPMFGPAPGIAMMWTGLALLSLLAVVIYRKLLRN